MMKRDTHSHPFSPVLTRSGATVTPVRPALSIREAGGRNECQHKKPPKRKTPETSVTADPKADPWPPLEFCLPNLDRLEEISHGEYQTQRELFPERPDDSRAGRIARLTAAPPPPVLRVLPGGTSQRVSHPGAWLPPLYRL